MKYAEILLLQKVGFDQETLTYEIPEKFHVDLKPGQAVTVPLRNRDVSGLVWQIHNRKPNFRTKPINFIVQAKPLLSPSQLQLMQWMSKQYFTPLFTIAKLFLNKRLLENKAYKNSKNLQERKITAQKNSKPLTEEQNQALDFINNSTENNFLVHGVTGAGKTELYCKLAAQAISQGKQALILVPEISLTPQTIKYFETTLQTPAAVIHSKITASKRYRNWQAIWQNEAKLIIGSRSAIFSPFQKLHTIIIDEEHENSYKQDSSPRYKIHEVIEEMQKIDPKLRAIYGSATPSIETATILKDNTTKLKKRIGNRQLPTIEIVDLRQEFKKGNYSIFSEDLQQALKNTIESNNQAILFLNRRGTASSMICRDCGEAATCAECEIPMTYHSYTMSSPSLICHHCGKISPPLTKCANCKSAYIKYVGVGTERIEEELKKLFPQARVLRADKDTTSKKNSFKEIYQQFRDHKADFLVGTQMIAKGLHLPKVSLVGVVISDIGLNIPDFRSSERIFQLMTQVAGRAGRGDTAGKVLIQTYNPDHHIYQFIKAQDFDQFYNYERTQRELLKNPPYSHLCKITIEENSLRAAKQEAESVAAKIQNWAKSLKQEDQFQINVYPAYIPKIKQKYRYIVLIKELNEKQKIHQILRSLKLDSLKIDVNPSNIN